MVWQRELLDTYSDQKAADLIAKFREQQVWQTPTLILPRNDAFLSSGLNLVDDPRTKYVPAKILENWRTSYEQQVKNISNEEFSLRAGLLEKSLGLVGQLQKGGVKILAGTDSTAPYVIPGFGLHDEMELLVKAGLTPMEALQAATRNPAEFLGHLDSQERSPSGRTLTCFCSMRIRWMRLATLKKSGP